MVVTRPNLPVLESATLLLRLPLEAVHPFDPAHGRRLSGKLNKFHTRVISPPMVAETVWVG